MDFGISIATAADSWKLVKRAEELGFTYAWFFDTQMLNADPFVAMAAAAVNTRTIHLGTGVLIPSNRLAPVTANALASLNKLAPGRIHFGVGTGFTARRSMGLGAVKLDTLADYVRVVQSLLKQETIEWEYEGRRRAIRFLNPELDLINVTDTIRLYISAFGPRGRNLIARLGAGWIYGVRNAEVAVAQLGSMRKVWTDAGRDSRNLYAVAQASGCVLAEGEAYDTPRAKAQAGPAAVMVLHDLAEADERRTLGYRLPPELQPLLDEFKKIYAGYTPKDAKYLQVHRWHLMRLRPEEEHLATAEMIRRMTLTGTLPQLREQIRTLRDAGYSQLAVQIRYAQESMIEDWADVIAGV